MASIIKRPVVIINDKLFFRIGIRWNACIDLSNIQTVEKIKNFKKDKVHAAFDCSLTGSPNIKIILTDAVELKSFYGIKKKVKEIVCNIDNEDEFIEKLKH